MHIFLLIVLWFFLAGFGLLLVVLFTPFIVKIHIDNVTGFCEVVWGLPWVCRIRYSFPESGVSIKIAGRTFSQTKSDNVLPPIVDKSSIKNKPESVLTETAAVQLSSPLKTEHDKLNADVTASKSSKKNDSKNVNHDPVKVVKPSTQKNSSKFRSDKKSKETSSPKRRIWHTVKFFWKQGTLYSQGIGWIKHIGISLFKIISFKQADVAVRIGFEDPALTGVVAGGFFAISGVCKNSKGPIKISCEPVFENAFVFSGNGYCILSTSLGQLCYPLLVALVKFPYVSAGLFYLKYRRFKKKNG